MQAIIVSFSKTYVFPEPTDRSRILLISFEYTPHKTRRGSKMYAPVLVGVTGHRPCSAPAYKTATLGTVTHADVMVLARRRPSPHPSAYNSNT